MKAKVDQDLCISCGMCIDICPEVFSYNSDNKSVAINSDIPKENISATEESRDACPVDAITIEENSANVNDNYTSEDIETYSSEE